MKMKQPDIFKGLKRGPQVITWKDASLIAGFTGVGPGYKIVDSGTGSGFLAIFLGNLVRPNGFVVSYEKRKDFARIARKNVRKVELEDVVHIKDADIFEGIDEREVDLVTLDMPEPWNVVRNAVTALKYEGFIVSYLPTVEQVKKFVSECNIYDMKHEMTIECMMRELLIRNESTRPQNKGITHTAYLTFVRKVNNENKNKEEQ